MMRILGVAVLVALAQGRARDVQGITPVQSVLNLLGKLEKQTMAEGKKEAAAYDKFACFCKEQADDKLYSITKKAEQIALLTARIETLDGQITGLNQDIAANNKEADKLRGECDTQQQARDTAFNAYAIERDDLAKAIKGCAEALDLLQNSRTPGLLIQEKISSVMLLAAATGSSRRASSKHIKSLTALIQYGNQAVPASGQAAGSKFHSGAIVEVIQNTLKTFKVNKNDVDAEEAEKKHTFDMAQGSRKNQIKALEDLLAEQETEAAKAEEARQADDDEKTKTTQDRKADDQFMRDLTAQCEEKATAWDTRSTTRANELTALSEATKTLKGEVVENYSANKHLNLVEEKQALSFLQVSKPTAVAVKKMSAYLKKQATSLKSKTLTAALVRMKEDHFVKVRGMIKDMIAKLEADANAEQDQKGWCDEQMKEATTDRDSAIGAIEGDLAAKTTANSNIVRLKEEIAELLHEVSELTKALNEATQLRTVEKADNTKTLAESRAGLAGVTKAMKILKNFYDNALIQYTPPNADADGNTVGDLAPETFSGENHGNQDAAVGIIGQLDVIRSDFDNTIEATETAETEAEDEFQSFKTESEADITEKEGSIKNKENEKVNEEGDHGDATDNLNDHTKDKTEALAELAKLKPACVDTGSDYAETVARREQEIESLKNAYVILDEMR